jgi:AhpD family alkylhydroperoxidase
MMSTATEKAPWYVQHSPDIGKSFGGFMKAAQEQGVLDKKTKELLMLGLACAFRCPFCTEEHIERAKQAGASEAEISEALLITALEGAGTQLHWARDVFQKHLQPK